MAWINNSSKLKDISKSSINKFNLEYADILNDDSTKETTDKKEPVVNFVHKTNKVFLYSSSIVFKNYKSYLCTLILPLIVVFLIFLFRTNFVNAIDEFHFPMLFLVPSIVLIVFFSQILLDWRKSTFIKQMTNFGVNKFSFISGFTATAFLCSLMATAFGVVYIYLFSLIGKSPTGFSDWAKFITNGTQILGLILSIIFSSLLSTFIAILFTGYLKNVYVIQTVNIALIMFFLLFSDMLVTPELTSKVKALCIIGYLDPYRCVSWLTLMFNAKMNINYYYVYFFLTSFDAYISFTKVWQPIVGCVGWIILWGSLATILFRSSTKK